MSKSTVTRFTGKQFYKHFEGICLLNATILYVLEGQLFHAFFSTNINYQKVISTTLLPPVSSVTFSWVTDLHSTSTTNVSLCMIINQLAKQSPKLYGFIQMFKNTTATINRIIFVVSSWFGTLKVRSTESKSLVITCLTLARYISINTFCHFRVFRMLYWHFILLYLTAIKLVFFWFCCQMATTFYLLLLMLNETWCNFICIKFVGHYIIKMGSDSLSHNDLSCWRWTSIKLSPCQTNIQ